MSRVQIALNVSDIDQAVAFYTQVLGTPPRKRREGYANFAVAEPPLKLVLIESPGRAGQQGPAGALNHLGIEVESAEIVDAAARRLAGAGLATLPEDDTTCCYARQTKVWVDDPDGTPWEVYTITDDAPADGQAPTSQREAGGRGTAGPTSADDADSTAGVCCSPA